MSTTGNDILKIAETHVEHRKIPTTKALIWINTCQIFAIGKNAGVTGSVTVTVEADTWTALPTTVLEIFEITKSGSTTPYYGNMYGQSYINDFDTRGFNIRFPEAGTYTIYFYALPTAMTALTESPSVPELFAYPMSLYLASKFKSYDDEENQDAKDLMVEFLEGMKAILNDAGILRPTTKASRIGRKVGY